jgi:hypothetical protein
MATNDTAPVNTRITIPSSSGNGTYTITKSANGSWHCSCPAWRMQHADPMIRTCKHQEQVIIDLGGYVVGAREKGNSLAPTG